jgi:pimeloyl-ACP methyl ester carboxylesterase
MLFDDADFLKKLVDFLNIKKFSLLGFSAGAITSMIFASKYPENAEKLLLISPASFVSDDQLEYFSSIRDIEAWPKKMREEAEKEYGKEYLKYLWESFVDIGPKIQKEITLDVIIPILKKIKSETLVFYGEKDPFVLFETDIETCIKNVEGSKLISYPDGAHKLQSQMPSEINEKVKEFLVIGSKI